MNTEENNRHNNESLPVKKPFNPIWALVIMGALIATVLILEVLGFKK